MSNPSGQHTPGPWTVCPFKNGLFPHIHVGPIRLYDYGNGDQCTGYLVINEGASPEQIAEYEATGDRSSLCGTTMETCQANALLIAAAPDMLAALKSAVADRIDDEWLKMARAVIAKAEGQ